MCASISYMHTKMDVFKSFFYCCFLFDYILDIYKKNYRISYYYTTTKMILGH